MNMGSCRRLRPGLDGEIVGIVARELADTARGPVFDWIARERSTPLRHPG